MKRMELQLKGGLASKEVIGIFTTRNEAVKVANMALLISVSIKFLKLNLQVAICYQH